MIEETRRKCVKNVEDGTRSHENHFQIGVLLVHESNQTGNRKNVCRQHDTIRPRDTKQNKAATATTVPEEWDTYTHTHAHTNTHS